MCSASTPYKENGTLYTLSDLLELHQVYNINKGNISPLKILVHIEEKNIEL